MKTNTAFSALFLSLSLAATACSLPDSDEGPPSVGTGGAGGVSTKPSRGRATSCVYEYSTEFQCDGSPAPKEEREPEVRCVNDSECGYQILESERAHSFPECSTITYRERQRVYEGTCDEYGEIVANGGEPQFPACGVSLDLGSCSECAQELCCDEMARCAGSTDCVSYLECTSACEDRFSAGGSAGSSVSGGSAGSTVSGGSAGSARSASSPSAASEDEGSPEVCRKHCRNAYYYPEANNRLGALRVCVYSNECHCGAL